MPMVLGVNATSATLWLALASDGVLVALDPPKFDLSSGLRRSRALEAGRDELAAMLVSSSVDLVVLAEPEVSKSTYQSLVGRISVETVLEFGAAAADVELVRLSRAKLRSVHDLPKSGPVSSHVSSVVDTPLAPHWKNKRDIAALAALAGPELVGLA